MNLLFVCAGNVQRSPTFEDWFKKYKPEYDVRSTGVYHGYPYKLNEELLHWADKVYVMDLSQEMYISRAYKHYLYKVEVVGCSDQYVRDSPELHELIWYWVQKEGL